MSRFLYLGMCIALCFAVVGFAQENGSLPNSNSADSSGSTDRQDSPAPEKVKTPQEIRKEARAAYNKANAEPGKLYPLVLEFGKQCEEAEAATNSAGGSAPIVKTTVQTAKAVSEKYPKSKIIKKIYAGVEEYPKQVDGLMATATERTKEVCELVKGVNEQQGKVRKEVNAMKAVAATLRDLSEDNAVQIAELAAVVLKQGEEARRFFDATMRQTHRKFSTAVAASHAVEELQAETKEALQSMATAAGNLNANGEDKPEVPVEKEKPVVPAKPSKSRTVTRTLPTDAPASSHFDSASSTETETKAKRKFDLEPVSPLPIVPKTYQGVPLNNTSDGAGVWNLNLVFCLPFLLFIFFPL